MQHIPKYVESTPKVKVPDVFTPDRRHPATYLRNRSWENEIAVPVPNATSKPKEPVKGEWHPDNVKNYYHVEYGHCQVLRKWTESECEAYAKKKFEAKKIIT